MVVIFEFTLRLGEIQAASILLLPPSALPLVAAPNVAVVHLYGPKTSPVDPPPRQSTHLGAQDPSSSGDRTDRLQIQKPASSDLNLS